MKFPELFVTDLDATALGGGYQPYARFSEPYAAFLDRLSAQGCLWAINTTWDINSQWQLVLGSPVRSRPAYLMGEMGLRLARITDDGPEMIQPYTRDMEARIQAVNESHFYKLINEMCAEFKPQSMLFYGHWLDFVPMEECAEKFIQYISVLRKNNTVFKFDYDNGRLTVYPALLNKGLPLAEVYRLNGISPSETVVAGDDFPDLCMMSRDLAFSAVCPGNAHPEVKKHVRSMDGEVGEAESGDGIIQAFTTLAEKQGWQF